MGFFNCGKEKEEDREDDRLLGDRRRGQRQGRGVSEGLLQKEKVGEGAPMKGKTTTMGMKGGGDSVAAHG